MLNAIFIKVLNKSDMLMNDLHNKAIRETLGIWITVYIEKPPLNTMFY